MRSIYQELKSGAHFGVTTGKRKVRISWQAVAMAPRPKRKAGEASTLPEQPGNQANKKPKKTHKREGSVAEESSAKEEVEAQQTAETSGLWLMKSEPDEFSWEDLLSKPDQTGCWDGVRNPRARNFMRAMNKSDQILFYYSSCKQPRVVGIVEVARTAYPDHTQFDAASKYYDPKSSKDEPKWDMVDIRAVRRLKRDVTLEELKAHADGALEGMFLLRIPRLSVQPVSKAHWDFILHLSEEEAKV